MRAYELKKDGVGQRGIIQMCVECDDIDAVHKVDTILSKQFKSDCYEQDDTPYGGKFSVGYFIDRNEKDDFMAAYKAAKASVKGK